MANAARIRGLDEAALQALRKTLPTAEGAKPAAEQSAEAPVAEAESIASGAPEAPAKPKRATKRAKAAEAPVATDDAQPTEPKKAKAPRKPRAKAAAPDAAPTQPEATTAPAVETSEPSPTAPVAEAKRAETPVVIAQPTAIEPPAPEAEQIIEEPKPLTARQQLEAMYHEAATKAHSAKLSVEPTNLTVLSDDELRAKLDALDERLRAANKQRQEADRHKARLDLWERAERWIRGTLNKAQRMRNPKTHMTMRDDAREYERISEVSDKLYELIMSTAAELPKRDAVKSAFKTLREGGYLEAQVILQIFECLFHPVTKARGVALFGANPTLDLLTDEGTDWATFVLMECRTGCEAYMNRERNYGSDSCRHNPRGITLTTLMTLDDWGNRPGGFSVEKLTIPFLKQLRKALRSYGGCDEAIGIMAAITPMPAIPTEEAEAGIVYEKCGTILTLMRRPAKEREESRRRALAMEEARRRERAQLQNLIDDYNAMATRAVELGINVPPPSGDANSLSKEALLDALKTLGKQVKSAEMKLQQAAHDRKQRINDRAGTIYKMSLIEDEPLTKEQALARATSEIEEEERAEAEAKARIERERQIAEASRQNRQTLEKLWTDHGTVNQRLKALHKPPLPHGFVDPRDLPLSRKRMNAKIAEIEAIETRMKEREASPAPATDRTLN